MFKFLKEKLKSAVNRITKKIEDKQEEQVAKVQNSKKIISEKILKKEEKVIREINNKENDAQTEQLLVHKEENIKDIEPDTFEVKKKGFFSKIKEKVTSKVLSEEEFENIFWELELVLIENNVAVEVIEKTKYDLVTTIKNSKHKPFTLIFFGVNGAGKTTTISKIASKLKHNNISCVLVAADTWRSAAIEQLEEQGNKVGVKVIKHQYGSDPTAVAYDGVAYAKAHEIQAVLIDTAGRQHNNQNLIQQMEKIVRVIRPNLKIFVGESTTGNDCIEQAKKFDEIVGIDGIILSKADVDERGGAAISISYVLDKPIIYLGMGQKVEDLKEFKKEEIINSLGL